MADQYFSEQPGSASDPVAFRLEIGGVALDLTTDAGVFARGRLDKGTRVLLQHAPEPADGDLLDLGCGYGPIALWLAAQRPASTVWALDVNDRALDLVRSNATAARLTNVRACRPDEVPGDVRFAQMWSNPPIRAGKAVLHELLLRWLPRVDGASYLVVSKNLGSDSLARWLAEQGYPTSRLSSHAGFRVLEVS
ncbi:MAG: Ribosomal RNA small subunit methyltransferase C [uncultured Actinomycetospora sp.]|uniref:Ribosomal RNA small subunit methyltransferase C n=1 Tax=uncultured Actinomycetospora sp. TaxID=1135996 RepID=A0A6J4IJT3_9PSEU|nr:MAG: Ribosomal RNA small subunit methyltransferase C [uncultured Actinomycetospora sp.]